MQPPPPPKGYDSIPTGFHLSSHNAMAEVGVIIKTGLKRKSSCHVIVSRVEK